MSDTVKILTREEALASTADLSAGAVFVVRWQLNALGDFKTLLAQLIARADEHNRERLRRGFPSEVDAVEAWLEGGLASELRAKGYDL